MSFIVGFLKEEFYRKFSGFFRRRSFLEKVSSKSKELASFFKAFLAIILHGSWLRRHGLCGRCEICSWVGVKIRAFGPELAGGVEPCSSCLFEMLGFRHS
ncbi:hypothetical protein ACFX1R_002499 [Malus domestica]